jgi:hypothetical protein
MSADRESEHCDSEDFSDRHIGPPLLFIVFDDILSQLRY